MTDIELIAQLDAYIMGHLPEKEMQALKTRIRNEPAVRAQLESQKRQLAALEILVQDDLRAKMVQWRKTRWKKNFYLMGAFLGLVFSGLRNGIRAGMRQWQRPWWQKPVFLMSMFLCIVLFGLWAWLSNTHPQQPKTTAMKTIETDTSQNKVSISQQTIPHKPIAGDVASSTTKTVITTTVSTQRQKMGEDVARGTKKTVTTDNDTRYAEAYAADLPADMEATYGNQISKGAATDSTDFEKAHRPIYQKDYPAAQAILGQIPPGDSNYNDARFNIAAMHFMKKEYDQAASGFAPLAEAYGYIYRDKAEWYLALSHLGNGNNAGAKVILEKIAQSDDNDYRAKAMDLSNKLKQK